jgi:hypothetical protein
VPFREKGITAAVQIQKYKGEGNDRNPYNHTEQDTFAYVNPAYLVEQIKATTAMAGQLAMPLATNNSLHFSLYWINIISGR